jgi:hypothetical protein
MLATRDQHGGPADDPCQLPGAQVLLHLTDEGLVVRVARPAPDPDRDPRAGDGEPDDDLGEIGAVVVRVAEAAEAGLARGTLVRLVEL